MGKMELKYLSQFRDRHGTLRYYFRIKGKRYPLPAPGSQRSRRNTPHCWPNMRRALRSFGRAGGTAR